MGDCAVSDNEDVDEVGFGGGLKGKEENKKAEAQTIAAPSRKYKLNLDSPSNKKLATTHDKTTDIEVANPFKTLSAYLTTTATT